MKNEEHMLFEAVKGMLHGSILGIKHLHGDPEDHEHSHNQQFAWSNAQEAFSSKIVDSTFYDSIRSAFTAVHSHKYLDDPKFLPAFVAELKSRAIPGVDQKSAVDAYKEVIKDLKNDERSAGWNENLDEIAERMQDLESEGESEPFTGGFA
jgi:hypothetical protein